MVLHEALQRLVDGTAGALSLSGRTLTVRDRPRLATAIDGLAHKAALASEPDAGLARWVIREAAAQIGIYPASIDGLYRARGRGASRNDFTVPAMNLRALSYHAARCVFRTARPRRAGALLFEIARSEMGYTNQRPAEYTSSLVAAAVAEGWQGPVFLQGDHFQISAKRFAETPLKEVAAVRDLIREAVQAGFFNIDIDTSTLVDLARPSIAEQQQLNYNLCAELALDVRRGDRGCRRSASRPARPMAASCCRTAPSPRSASTSTRCASCHAWRVSPTGWPAPCSTAPPRCPKRPSAGSPKPAPARSTRRRTSRTFSSTTCLRTCGGPCTRTWTRTF